MSPKECDGQSQRVYVVSHVLLGVGPMTLELDFFDEPTATRSPPAWCATATRALRTG